VVRIYTKKGDDGTTSLWYGGRVAKHHGRTDAYGSLDEACSQLGLDFARSPLWLVVLAVGSLAFGAMGVAIGGATREVRSASLAAFVVSLPVAALALVPSGAVADGIYDLIRVISAAFPFRPAMDALDAAISGGEILNPVLHLVALALVFSALARLSLKRFA